MAQDSVREIASAARRILDAYGHIETSDSSRTVYTDGDVNIAEDASVLEVIYRGTLVFRYAPDNSESEPVFEEHGDWVSIIERMAESIPDSPRDGE
ncbi:MAG: hypothetical protein M3362_23365 [Acidobacteriota bacterium]|nr:hypothetical protein [Acidobacteriota bacterium]